MVMHGVCSTHFFSMTKYVYIYRCLTSHDATACPLCVWTWSLAEEYDEHHPQYAGMMKDMCVYI